MIETKCQLDTYNQKNEKIPATAKAVHKIFGGNGQEKYSAISSVDRKQTPDSNRADSLKHKPGI